MIRPPGVDGVAFTQASDGDQRSDLRARDRVSSALGIDAEWATVDQTHGREVRRVVISGRAGPGDALWSDRPGLPLAVFTADCYGVVLVAELAVGVAHAGWRGAQVGVVSALRSAMSDRGHPPRMAVMGPGIGPCCFEVGPDVADRFAGHTRATTWGSGSVDLRGALAGELSDVRVESIGECTHHDANWFSHRRSGTPGRLATIAWLT